MRKVLIVVDMQNDFVAEKGVLSSKAAREILPFVRDKVRDTLAQGGEVVFTLDTHLEDDAEFAKFPPHCLKGSWGQELVAELQELITEEAAEQVHFVEKNRYSAFYKTDLEEHLGLTADSPQKRVAEVELVGVATNICCYFTAEELANRDVSVKVPVQGVASFDQKGHDFALEQMRTVLGVEIV